MFVNTKKNNSSEKYTINEKTSTFYYQVVYSKSNSDNFIKLHINHENDIDYSKFHKRILPTKLAVEILGYSYIDDLDIWTNKYKTDTHFKNKLNEMKSLFVPISEEEYKRVSNKKEN